MTEKDYSLLRPFDLEVAKAGADLCDREGCVIYDFLGVGENFDGSEAAGVRIKSSPYTDRPYVYFSPLNALRLAPLCWVKGRPVYPGDALEHTRLGEVVAKSEHASKGMLVVEKYDNLALGNLAWPRPKPVKRWVNIYPAYSFESQDSANEYATSSRIACIEIELPPTKP